MRAAAAEGILPAAMAKQGGQQPTLAEMLRERTVKGELCVQLEEGKVRCHACGHRCTIPEGSAGICLVRFNRDGVLRVPHGYVAGLQCDPIEKKPFYHGLPGTQALSFGMLGCDYHCQFCQNRISSQALRDPIAVAQPEDVKAEQVVSMARQMGARSVSSTYNEPLITSEWAVEIFKKARKAGLHTSYVSNGNATPEVLDYLRPWLDLYKVDLKGFRDRPYRELGGVLKTVLDTIVGLVDRGFWVEVVTLVVPGRNDSDEELRDIAKFLAGVSPDIPWHVTAFHPDYQMTDRERTPAQRILRACEIGRKAGLRYVYGGNLPGGVGEWENTPCPGCGKFVIERRGFRVLANRLRDGACPDCGAKVAGFWDGLLVPAERKAKSAK